MPSLIKHVTVAAALLALVVTAKAQTKIAAKDAAKHIGENVIIMSKIFGGKSFMPSKMILLDVGGDNPHQELTLMIPGPDRDKFKGQPEVDYKGKDVMITGKLVDFKGKSEIVVNDPAQVKLVLIDNMRTPAVPMNPKDN